jgi:cyanophycin synthetase
MCQLVERLEPKGRKLVQLAAPGDRRDEDIHEIGRIAAGRFDRYIVRRDDHLRGRESDEVPRMLRDALLANGVRGDQIELIPDEPTAVSAVLTQARRDDLVLCFTDQITRTWKQVTQFRPNDSAAAERSSRPVFVEVPEVSEPVFGDSEQVVRDERGVRLARESED